MKAIFICFVLSFSCWSYFCNQVIQAVYGPFLSDAFYQEYLTQYQLEIEKSTDCKVKMTIKVTHKEFLLALMVGRFDMAFVPGFCSDALKPYDIRAILVGKAGFKSIFIVNIKTFKPGGFAYLESKTMLAKGSIGAAILC